MSRTATVRAESVVLALQLFQPVLLRALADTPEPLSEYEQARNEKIARNRAFLAALGLGDAQSPQQAWPVVRRPDTPIVVQRPLASQDVVDALETVVNGLINGAGSVVDTAGSVTENVLTDLFDVKATHVFKGAGKLAKQLADNIGGVVRQIPYVGNATGYVVESAGGGVFHVILSVGKLIGSTSRRLGRVAKKTTDLVVFTLHAGRDQIKDTAVSVDDIVDRVGNSLVGRSGKSAKTLKGAGGGRVRRRRGGE